MPIKPYQVGAWELLSLSSRVDAIAKYVDHLLVHQSKLVEIFDESGLHYSIAHLSYTDFGLNEFEINELETAYRRQGWQQVGIEQTYSAQTKRSMVILTLHPPVADTGLVSLIDQVREFVGDRPVKMLTRKHNSRHDSGVAYQRPDLSATDQHVLDLHLSAHGTHVVAASSTRPKRLLASQ